MCSIFSLIRIKQQETLAQTDQNSIKKRKIQFFVPECVRVYSVSSERSISGGHANHSQCTMLCYLWESKHPMTNITNKRRKVIILLRRPDPFGYLFHVLLLIYIRWDLNINILRAIYDKRMNKILWISHVCILQCERYGNEQTLQTYD